MSGREDGGVLQRTDGVAADRVDFPDTLDLITEKFNAQSVLPLAGGDDLQHVSLDPEAAAGKIHIVALVLNVHQPGDELIPAQLHAGAHADHHALVFAGVAHGINAADAGDDNHVLAFTHRGGSAVAQTVDFFIDGGVLLNVGVAGGDIGLGLIIVVVGHEILHRAVREEGPKLAAKLGGQRLVVGQHQRGLLHPLDHGSHGEGFAAAGHAQQHLIFFALQHAPGQTVDGGRLIAGGGVGSLQDKSIHPNMILSKNWLYYSTLSRFGKERARQMPPAKGRLQAQNGRYADKACRRTAEKSFSGRLKNLSTPHAALAPGSK